MTESFREELFLEPKSSFGLKFIAVVSALVVTVALLVGYTYLRKRHAGNVAATAASAQSASAPKKPPTALILVDDALLKGNNTTVAGTVKNISQERLGQVTVELELKRRKDGQVEKKLVRVEPSQLEPGQEGRYSLELKIQDYGSARLLSLRTGPDATSVAYSSASGQKRPPERLETKTIIVGRPPSKHNEFLNSPENPARVP